MLENVYEGSLLDEYDKENGYLDDSEEIKKVTRRDLVFYLYRTMYENGSSFTECQNTDFCSYIDFLCYLIDKKEEEKELEGEVNK